MPIIKIQGVEMDVDIRGELEEFTWTRPRWTANKLIAASPFRYDKTPSFFVNLDGEYAGTWSDSGAYDADYESGNFAKLLAFLRDETYEETVEYLFDVYKPDVYDKDGYIKIYPITLESDTSRVQLSEDVLSEYKFRHPYLEKRGISEKVQRFMGVGYSKQSRAVTIPWRHPDGTLANVKFRKTQGKTFWYRKGAAPIRTLIYGIDKVYRHNLREVYVGEAEIDAMSWWTCERPAIAVGGTTFSQEQAELLRKSPIDTLIIAKDNDKPGEKLERQLSELMRGYVTIKQAEIPSEYKDANEALLDDVDLSEVNVTNTIDKYRVSLYN